MNQDSQYNLIIVLGFVAGIVVIGFILWLLFRKTPQEKASNSKLNWTPEYYEEQKQKLDKMKKEMGINWQFN